MQTVIIKLHFPDIDSIDLVWYNVLMKGSFWQLIHENCASIPGAGDYSEITNFFFLQSNELYY